MAIEVEAPDGTIVEFPDGTSDETIAAAMRAAYPPAIAPARATVRAPRSNWGAVILDALAPYGVAAGGGAAAGLPAGGVGAIPGAVGGTLALGATDILSSLYNLAAPYLGTPTIPTGSEAIRQGTRSIGLTQAPSTPAQRIAHQTISFGAGAGTQAPAALLQAGRMAPGLARGIVQTLGESPLLQTAGATGAGLASSTSAEMGASPAAQYLFGLGGGLLGGRAVANVPGARPRAVTTADVRAQGTRAYERAKQAGVSFTPSSVSNFATDLRGRLDDFADLAYDPGLHPRVGAAVRYLDELTQAQTPIGFSDLERARRLAQGARRSADADERRLGNVLVEQIDDFIANVPSSAVTGNRDEAVSALTQARQAWRRQSQASNIEEIIDAASRSTQTPYAYIRNRFNTILNNPNTRRRYDAQTQQAMRNFVSGRNFTRALDTLGRIAPGTDLRGLIATGTGIVSAQENPLLAAAALGTGAAARVAAGRRAEAQAQEIVRRTLGAPPRPGTARPATIGAATQLARQPTLPSQQVNPLLAAAGIPQPRRR